jgi:MFS family permease
VQTVAQGWLVLQLTDSAFAVGLVTALGSLPILLFTLYGGVVADRVDKRRFVILLQSGMLLEALALAVLTHQGWITVHLVMALASFYGLLSAFEVPTRQSLVSEIVGKDDLMNAIALNSSAFNVARVIGPSIAGALIATVGLAACFYLNAASYLAVLTGLLLMRVRRPAVPARAPALGALKEGFGYIFGNAWPRALVIIVAGFTVFGASFLPMMPVYARDILGLDADGYGALVSAIGLGAASGAIGMAASGARIRQGRVVIVTFAIFGAVLAGGGYAGGFWWALALFTLAGCLMAVNGIMANTMLQLQAPDRLRGRVMGFYSFVVLGMAPFGAFQAGWVSEHFGVRTAFALGGIACMIMAGVVGFVTRAPGFQPQRSEGPYPGVPDMRVEDPSPSLRSGSG